MRNRKFPCCGLILILVHPVVPAVSTAVFCLQFVSSPCHLLLMALCGVCNGPVLCPVMSAGCDLCWPRIVSCNATSYVLYWPCIMSYKAPVLCPVVPHVVSSSGPVLCPVIALAVSCISPALCPIRHLCCVLLCPVIRWLCPVTSLTCVITSTKHL